MKTAIVILVCFLMPILLTICLSRKQKGLWVSFVVGMLAFVISQMVLRLPLLSIMTQQRSISLFTLKHPVLYILILAFTAGLFEETARLIGFQCIKKKHASIYDAFAFGLGHGGIEAMLLIGIPLLSVSTDLSSVLLAEQQSLRQHHKLCDVITSWSNPFCRYDLLTVSIRNPDCDYQ